MVSAWYPALAPLGRPDAYATPEESALILASLGLAGFAPDSLSKIRMHAYVDAPRAGHPLPTVVLSPGFSMPRASLTGLAEELAGRGYLVLGIDHTYEASAVTFPDGRITECEQQVRAADPLGCPGLVSRNSADQPAGTKRIRERTGPAGADGSLLRRERIRCVWRR